MTMRPKAGAGSRTEVGPRMTPRTLTCRARRLPRPREPSPASALSAGLVMAWARALVEFGATIMFVAVRLRGAGDRDTPG